MQSEQYRVRVTALRRAPMTPVIKITGVKKVLMHLGYSVFRLLNLTSSTLLNVYLG